MMKQGDGECIFANRVSFVDNEYKSSFNGCDNNFPHLQNVCMEIFTKLRYILTARPKPKTIWCMLIFCDLSVVVPAFTEDR